MPRNGSGTVLAVDCSRCSARVASSSSTTKPTHARRSPSSLRDEGYDVETAADAFKALGKFESFAPHVVVTDLKMPGMDGIELVKKLRADDEPPAVVVMTAFGAVETAVEAMRAGAADYLTKPLNFDELLVVLDKVLEHQAAAPRDPPAARSASAIASRRATSSASARRCSACSRSSIRSRRARATVLITGESGTGKELVANAIHQRSPRANGPFVKLHCAALAESLLESELFGHEKGSFTGAMARKDGRFELADGGTLFLDEIGEISPAIQVKLLRFLQEHEFERVGGTQTIKVDVRIDRRDEPQPARGGREGSVPRGSLLPAQRRRARDAAAARAPERHPGAREVLPRPLREGERQAARRLRARRRSSCCVAYDWPGNVRELENAIERAVVLAHRAARSSRATCRRRSSGRERPGRACR